MGRLLKWLLIRTIRENSQLIQPIRAASGGGTSYGDVGKFNVEMKIMCRAVVVQLGKGEGGAEQ